MMKDPFDQYPISTQTLIISTNITIDCLQYFEAIVCPEVSKPISGKTRMMVQHENEVPEGSIVFAQYKQHYKGTAFKKISEKYFLNSVTIIMRVHTKFINIKVSNKGKLQITGCNENIYALSILKYFWRHLEPLKNSIWSFQTEGDNSFEAVVVPVMCNINFSIPFQINRESLNSVINTQTQYVSILEPSDGYVGVNIKITVKEESLEEIHVDRFIHRANGEWEKTETRFMDYILTLSPKEQKKKIAKCYVNTFLVFYSGKVIMSGGISHTNRKCAYHNFMEIVHRHRDAIQAKNEYVSPMSHMHHQKSPETPFYIPQPETYGN